MHCDMIIIRRLFMTLGHRRKDRRSKWGLQAVTFRLILFSFYIPGMLKKSYSAYGIAAAPSDDESSSPYSGGRSLKVKSKRPANFLRNLFSTNDQGGKKANKHDDLRQPRIITQSDYFMPKTLK